jgi:hypothetical protein
MVGKIILRVRRQYPGGGPECIWESEAFCLETEACSEECAIPTPTVRAVHCIEPNRKYYVHWDFPQDGIVEPCNYGYGDVDILDLNNNVVGHFEWIEHQAISGYWHLEGVMVITNGTHPSQTCWDIPFCLIGTTEECGTATVCPGTSDPQPNYLLDNCEDFSVPVCDMTETLLDVTCDEDPINKITHTLTVQIVVTGLLPNTAFDIQVTSITGTIFDPSTGLNYLWLNNLSSGANGVLNTTFDIPWYDELGTDFACFEVYVKYDTQNPNGPWGDVCWKRFCFDLNEFPPCTENLSGGERNYRFSYECHEANGITATYLYDLEFPEQVSITQFSIEGQYGSTDSELIYGGNRLSGRLTTDYYKPVFKYNVSVRENGAGAPRVYSVEELLRLCPQSGNRGASARRAPGSSGNHSTEDFPYLRLSPNPASEELNIEFNIPEASYEEGMEIRLINLLGACLETLPVTQRHGKIRLDTGSRGNGVYYLVLKGNKGIITPEKLIINR